MTPERETELIGRYEQLLHAIQSGVQAEMALGSGATEPKHLRTGLEARACDHCALAELLIETKVIDREAYFQALNAQLAREVERYESRISLRLGKPVKLV